MPTKATPITSLNLAIIHWSQGKNMTGSKLHIPNRILCNAADLDDLSEEKAPAQIQIEQHSDFRWQRAKSLETMSGVIVNRLQSKFAAQSVEERASAQIRIEQHSDFRWRRNYVRRDYESIATKVCSQIGRKLNATCPRKGRLLRFELHSTATSDGGAQML